MDFSSAGYAWERTVVEAKVCGERGFCHLSASYRRQRHVCLAHLSGLVGLVKAPVGSGRCYVSGVSGPGQAHSGRCLVEGCEAARGEADFEAAAEIGWSYTVDMIRLRHT